MAKKLGRITKILRLATKYLSKGWTRGAAHRQDEEGEWFDSETGKTVVGGCYCITGALARAAYDVCGKEWNHDVNEMTYACDDEVVEMVGQDLNLFVEQHGFKGVPARLRPDGFGLIHWNDGVSRKKAQVVKALERAAAKAQEMGV